MTSLRLTLVGLGALAFGAVGIAPAAAALPTLAYTYASPSIAITVDGTTVDPWTSIQASQTTELDQVTVCVRTGTDPTQGTSADFAWASDLAVAPTGTAVDPQPKVLSPGTYVAFVCGQDEGSWFFLDGTGSTGSQVFVVAPISTPAPAPTPAPMTLPTAPSWKTPSWRASSWRASYVEDFTRDAPVGRVGAVYGSDLRGYEATRDTTRKGLYAPDQVLSVSDGVLTYDLRTEAGVPLVAAPQPLGYGGQLYGRFEVRWRTNLAPSYAVAFLLWPASEQWDEGEVDWPEVHGLGTRPRPASAIPGSYGSGGMTFTPTPLQYATTTTAGWHTDVTEWRPGSVSWYRDGALVASTTTAVPSTPFRWSLQAETNPEVSFVPAAEVGVVQIDSLRAWTYAGGPAHAAARAGHGRSRPATAARRARSAAAGPWEPRRAG